MSLINTSRQFHYFLMGTKANCWLGDMLRGLSIGLPKSIPSQSFINWIPLESTSHHESNTLGQRRLATRWHRWRCGRDHALSVLQMRVLHSGAPPRQHQIPLKRKQSKWMNDDDTNLPTEVWSTGNRSTLPGVFWNENTTGCDDDWANIVMETSSCNIECTCGRTTNASP